MTIVSVSLNRTILDEMDKLEKSHGFSGRSEIVRAGIRNLISEERKRQDYTGMLHALFLAIHDEDSDDDFWDLIPKKIQDKADDVSLDLFLEKSRKRYEQEYDVCC